MKYNTLKLSAFLVINLLRMIRTIHQNYVSNHVFDSYVLSEYQYDQYQVLI